MVAKVKQQEAYFSVLVHRLASNRVESRSVLEGPTSEKVSPKPIIIRDLNLKPLFYLFLQKNPKGKIIGSSWVTADPQTHPSIVAETWNELTWNPNKARAMAKNWARQEQKPGEKVKVYFICYSYPKIGVLAQIIGTGGRVRTEKMFDVVFGQEISLEAEKKNLGAKSHATPDARSTSPLDPVREPTGPWYGQCLSGREATGLTPADIENRAAACARGLELAVQKKELDVPFYQQQTDSWCVPACANMILSAYGIDVEQTEIAAAMETTSLGTPLRNETVGYKQFQGGDCEIAAEDEASWDFIKDRIDHEVPVRIRIDGDRHAIVCKGYIREEVAGGGADIWLIVNDPYLGEAKQNWNNMYVTNFLTLANI